MTARSTKRLSRWATRLAIGAVVALLLISCSSDDPGPDLEALQNDPMAGDEIPGAKLTRRSEQPRSFGSATSSKPNPARIILSFAVKPDTNKENLLAAAAAKARDAGWDIQPSGGGHSGTRQLPETTGTQTASISIYISDGDNPPQRELNVILQNPAP